MLNKNDYIGQDLYGAYIFQEVKDGLIRGFNSYNVVETVEGTKGLENVQWTHKAIMKVIYRTGDKPAPVVDMPNEIQGLYEINTISCEECGAQHDSETDVYGNGTYVIVNECEVYCKECVKSDQILTLVTNPQDFFKAKDIRRIDLSDWEEIETLFCDSSGFGQPGEAAFTKKQALNRVNEILFENADTHIYAGITDIGQFQVYVTLYRKAS